MLLSPTFSTSQLLSHQSWTLNSPSPPPCSRGEAGDRFACPDVPSPSHMTQVTRHTSHRDTHKGCLKPVHQCLCIGRTLSLGFQSLLTILILTCIYFLSSPTTLKYPSHEAASRWILIGTFFSAALSPVTRTAAPSLTVLKLAASHSFFPLNTLRPWRLLFV